LYSLALLLAFTGAVCLLNPLPKHVALAVGTLLVLSFLALVKAALDSNPLHWVFSVCL
jgi:hypothetical protein